MGYIKYVPSDLDICKKVKPPLPKVSARKSATDIKHTHFWLHYDVMGYLRI